MIGGVLLLQLPSEVFDAVVPILILLAVVLMALRPSAKLRERGDNMPGGIAVVVLRRDLRRLLRRGAGDHPDVAPAPVLPRDLQVLNAIKNVLAAVANLVAGVLFVFVAHVAWGAAALIAVGSTVGAQVGAHYGRRLPQEVLRWVVIVYGTIVAMILILT